MFETTISQTIIGARVTNRAYGTGLITDFFKRSDDKHYVSVLFDSFNEEKVFIASIAFSKGILVFENAEMNNAAATMIEEARLSQKAPEQNSTETHSTGLSSNDITNYLIQSVLDDEQIATDLIDFYGDEAFEKNICEEAFSYLERIMTGSNLGKAQKACIVCALSLIALKYYDGDLHSYIEQKFREYRPYTEYKYSRTTIQNAVCNALSEYRKRTKYFDPRSYVAVPLVLSCVPHYRLKDLFRISYDIYKQKLLFDEDLSDEQIEDKVRETFATLRRRDLISDSDTIKGTNYLMSKYTQSIISSEYGIDSLSQIVTHCIRLIISHLTRPEDSFVVEPYYSEGYAAWVSAFESDDKERNKYDSVRTLSQPYLKLVNNQVHLFSGEFSIDDAYDPNDVHICVYNGDSILADIKITDPNAIEFAEENSAMSGYILRRQEVSVAGCPIGTLSYSIECSGHRLYDSKARLHRSTLFFDGKGNEIRPGSSYSGELFVITQKTNKEEYGERITEIYCGNGFIISTIEVNEHEVFLFDGEPYIFYKISSSQLISHEIPWGDFTSFEGKQYQIYNDLTVLFPTSCDKEYIYLEIDGQKYYYGDISDIHFSIRLFSKEYRGTWAYTVKVYNLEPGFHTVRIFNSVSGKQINGAYFGVIYDPAIRKEFISKNSTGILYDLSGSFIDDQPLLFEYGMPKKEFHAFVKNLGHGSLNVYPSAISYSIDDKTWEDIDTIIYLCEIPESIKTLFVCGPRNMTAFYLDADAIVKKQAINLEPDQEQPTLYKIYLSLLRTILGKKKARVSFEYGYKTKYVNIWYNPFVLKDDCHFFYDSETKQHIFDVTFEGSSKVKVVIKPLNSDVILLAKPISSGERITLDDASIDDSIKFLSIALHGRKYGALFDPFQQEPFMFFPKYDLGRKSAELPTVRLTTFPPAITLIKKKLSGRVFFEGAAKIKAEIIPSGFSTPLQTKTLLNGDGLLFDISMLPFNSYKIYLYSPIDQNASVFAEKPFFISKPVKVESPFLHNTFSVSAFILSDGSKVKTSYSIRFNTIAEINNLYYLVASMKNKTTGDVLDDLIVFVKKALPFQYEVAIRRRQKDKVVRLKLKNGKMLEGVVIEK